MRSGRDSGAIEGGAAGKSDVSLGQIKGGEIVFPA